MKTVNLAARIRIARTRRNEKKNVDKQQKVNVGKFSMSMRTL